MSTLEHVIWEVPTHYFVGDGKIQFCPVDLSSGEPQKEVTLELCDESTVKFYCIRWSDQPDVIAAIPCADEPTALQKEHVGLLLRQMFRKRGLPWPQVEVVGDFTPVVQHAHPV